MKLWPFMQHDTKISGFTNAACWSARVLGTLFVAIVVLFVIAHTISGELPRFWQEPLNVQLEFVALVLMTSGAMAGWKWPGAASVIMLLGYVIWRIIERRLPWPPSFIEIPLAVALLYGLALWGGIKSIAQQRRAVQ